MAVGTVRCTEPESFSRKQAAVRTTDELKQKVDRRKGRDLLALKVGHKKSRKGCAQCKRRHVKCNEEKPCSNCVRHGVACSLAGGPYVPREDTKDRRTSAASSSSTVSRTTSQEGSFSSTAGPRSPSGQPSPFSALTGLIERPAHGEDTAWIPDLELMHHYMTHTRLILTEHQDLDYILQIWQVEMPKVAFAHDYVMHGLLGFSALHKAHIEPPNTTQLHATAVDHLDKALVLYRSESLKPTTAENATAKFVFTWIVALFAYAIPPSLPPIDAIVELFLLVKGIDAILSETWFWVSQSVFAPILRRGFQEALSPPEQGYTLPEGTDYGLNHLDFMLTVEPMVPEERRLCSSILSELKQIYDMVLRAQATCSIASILCFPKQDAAAFAQLIKRRTPQALIILAYYCVLLDVLDSRWWIHGWAARVLRDVLGSLQEPWRQWIEWPVQSVLMKERRPPMPPVPPPVSEGYVIL